MKKINKSTIVFSFIAIILFVIPFSWLKPGEMDLGGDSSRLYFYDPLSMLKEFSFYSIATYGTGTLIYNQYFTPFLLFMGFLKFVFVSPTLLIGIFNGLKLSGSFVFMYLIIKELLHIEKRDTTKANWLASILGALFYTFSSSVVDNMKYALITHNQVFLNPILFYCILRYFVASSLKYIWLALLITVIFSASFPIHSPTLFAFYPLGITFLLLYNFLVLRKPFLPRGIIIGVLFFLGLHAFQLLPLVSNVFDKGSEFNTRVFEGAEKTNPGLEYFNARLQFGKVSEHILLPLENQKNNWSLVIIPTLTISGLICLNKKNKTLLLVSTFFFISLFFVSANITQIGVEFYRKLFLIPGFGMFRNFSGQWQWVYTFFYSVLIGLTTSYLFSRLKKKYAYIIVFVTIGCMIVRSWIVFNGNIVNVLDRGSKNAKVVIRMDPHYEEMLSYIKKIPNDGKILHVPFTDFPYNLLGGSNKGVYVGQSLISQILGKNDFAGYPNIDPFSEVLVKLSREKNYQLIQEMMSLLQVRYVLYNSDEMISDKFFPTFPYGYSGIPSSPSGALEFTHAVSDKKIYEAGHYSLFEVNKKSYLPHFYVVPDIFFYNTNSKYETAYFKAMSFFPEKPLQRDNPRIAFLDRESCKQIFPPQICGKTTHHEDVKNIRISFQRINPIKYKLEIQNATKPFLLVFQTNFNPYWKLFPTSSFTLKKGGESYFDGEITEFSPMTQFLDPNPFETNGIKSIFDDSHIEVNGYSNAWYIRPEKATYKKSMVLIVEMTRQKMVYYSLGVSGVCLIIFLLLGIRLFKRK